MASISASIMPDSTLIFKFQRPGETNGEQRIRAITLYLIVSYGNLWIRDISGWAGIRGDRQVPERKAKCRPEIRSASQRQHLTKRVPPFTPNDDSGILSAKKFENPQTKLLTDRFSQVAYGSYRCVELE